MIITFVILNKIETPHDFYIYSRSNRTSKILGSEKMSLRAEATGD